MWLQYFGLQEDPFGVSPDPRYLYPSQTHQEALESLEDGFYNNRGFIAMIAPPGMGKTTLLYRFLEDTRAYCAKCVPLRCRCRVRTPGVRQLHPAGIRHCSRAKQFRDAQAVERRSG